MYTTFCTQMIMEAEHGSDMVLDPTQIFTFFSVLPKLDKGCYTAITYASLVGAQYFLFNVNLMNVQPTMSQEPILQGTLWFTSMARVVVLLSPGENILLIQMQQEFKPSYSSLSYGEVFYMEMPKDDTNTSGARITLFCPTNSYKNLTEKMVNVWNPEALGWLKQHQRHYKQLYGALCLNVMNYILI